MLTLSILLISCCQSGSFGIESAADFSYLPDGEQIIRFLDDLNGDGIPEFLTSDNSASLTGFNGNGKLEVHSGATGAPLATIAGQSEYARLGKAILPIDDLNGDGVQDFLATTLDARVSAYSGATFSLIYQTTNPWGVYSSWYPVLTEIGDVDGDQVPDFSFSDNLVMPQNGDLGAITVFSGATGNTIWTIEGISGTNFRIGDAATGVSDVDLDGFNDIVISSSNSIACYSGALGSIIWTASFPGFIPFDNILANISDSNGDGYADIAHGDRYSNEVKVFSGFDGSLLYTVTALSRDWRFGYSLLGVEDFDGDGAGDFLVGSSEAKYKGRFAGWIYLISGTTGQRLGSFPGLDGYRFCGAKGELLNAGDWTGDGVSEWATVYHDQTGQPTALLRVQKFIPPLSFQITGTCPGLVTANISGGTPNGLFGIVAGTGGAYSLLNGPVEELELATGIPIFSTIQRFDATGSKLLLPTLPAGACGLKVQAFDFMTRSTSPALTL